MAANKPPLHRADLSNIEVEGAMINTNGKWEMRSWYFVRLHVANKEVASSKKKPAGSVLKWEWDPKNQILFEPSSTIKIVLYRGLETDVESFNHLVGQHEGNLADLLENNTSFQLKDKKGDPVSVRMNIALSRASTLAPKSNPYLAFGGPSGVVVDPENGVQQAKPVGGIIYEGLKEIVDILHECSDAFPPLKTATAIFQNISKFVETILENKQELKDLEAKLGVILLIVEKYKKDGGVDAITHRIEEFSKAITVHLNAVEALQKQSMMTSAASAQKDADAILKALGNIISLCDIFQIDTQLNIDITVGKVLEYMNSGLIDKLNHEMTSYKTRKSSYGDPTGCMEGTRVKVLEDLDAWASDADAHKVYWMVGMAGVGKSTIAHTFCQMLEAKNMLSGSFFASRASEKTSNARLIIPVIAHALARSSPPTKVKVVKAIEDDPTLAEPTYSNMREQFKQLVYDPIQATTGMLNKPYKVIVIDAIDECGNLEVVASFIKLVLQLVSKMPLKVFVSSRQELEISDAFSSGNSKVENFRLHDIEKDVVQKDISKYLEISLANIRDKNPHGTAETWPLESELAGLIARCGRLFIYAATAIRYIASGGRRYKYRLSEMAKQGLESVTEFKTDIDTLYIHILEMACKEKRLHEVTRMRDIVSIVVFLRNPLPIQALESLSEMDALSELSLLTSVIHLPDAEEATVAPFHASFPDFVTSAIRCSPERSPFRALDASEGHTLLALKCLQLMNRSLKYNMCEIPEELTMSHIERTNLPENVGKISRAVKYSCVYWAAHLAEVKVFNHELIDALYVFLYEHLLHWIECLSMLHELRTGLKALSSIATILSSFGHDKLWLFVDDARRCLQMSFEGVQQHCMEIYQSALVWIPKGSLIRQTYDVHVRKVPKVCMGLPDMWGAAEHVLQNGPPVESVAFSPDGSQVITGSAENTAQIWNVTTGELEAELKGHTDRVKSVTFSQDGSRVVSGSADKTIRIWNVTTGEVEAELKGHTDSVNSVAFSRDGGQVASGSTDETVRIWDVATGNIEAELKDDTGSVNSVAFSPENGSQVISGSADFMVRIWNVTTGNVEAALAGHTNVVMSVAFSQDGSRIVSGSYDRTVRIWNATTGEVEAKLDHTNLVLSVGFSPDGNRVVSGSLDNIVRIWNVTMGEVEVELKGHIYTVYSVGFSPKDGSRVVSGSGDIRIWNATPGKAEASELKGHTKLVLSVAFSQDGSRVVSGSYDHTIRIWNVTTGEVDAELKGHTDSVNSVAFLRDGSRVVSGSDDNTVRIWNVTTGDVEALMKGHTERVTSVVFSQDGSRVVSGSADKTVRIWNVTTGEVEAELNGHTDSVNSVTFSQDGGQVASGSTDETVRIWDVATGNAEAELKGHVGLVYSVAFSLDGSQVVSSSDDITVRIWNATTGHSQSMTTFDTRLPDGSRVIRTKPYDFCICYPNTPSMNSALQLTANYQSVMASFYDWWIPSQYSDISCSSVWGSLICFGFNSGHVVIFDTNVAL